MIRQIPVLHSTSSFNAVASGMTASAGSNTGDEQLLRPAQWSHRHPHGAPAADNLTAHAGGGKASATLIAAAINRFSTVTTAADSAKLPVSAAGLWITVINDSANVLQLFGSGIDTINGVATATGVSIAAGKTGFYCCPVAGKWFGGTFA